MTAARLIGLGINLSMTLMVFSVSLSASARQVASAFKNPGLLARSLVAMYVVMPLVAVVVALNFDLNHALLVALILLALSPVPPVLPGKQIKAGGSEGFVVGLLVVASLAAIVIVPAGVALVGRIFNRALIVPFSVTTNVVVMSILLPVVAGLVVARFAPRFAEKAARPISIGASVLLFALLLPLLWAARHAIASQLGHFTIVAIVLFSLAGLAAGHLLGGPDPNSRTALALATATRHPGVALGVLHVIAPEEKGTAIVVLLYLLVGVVASAPYVAWRKRARTPSA